MDNQAPGVSSKGKAPLAKPSAAIAGSGSSSLASSATGVLSAMANSAKSTLEALDPRHVDVVRLNGAMGSGSGGGSSNSSNGTFSSKPSTSASQSAYQHASSALGTLSESSASASASSASSLGPVASGMPRGFRTLAPTQASNTTTTTPMMDWDSFLASPESDLIDSTPYRPPAMSAFSFSPMRQENGGAAAATTTTTTAMVSSSSVNGGSVAATRTWEETMATAGRFFSGGEDGRIASRMVHEQQMADGMEVVAFLQSTSHADYVEALEAVEVDRHQAQRKQFQYGSGEQQQQHQHSPRQQDLPSDQQDIVAYAEGQRTTADDLDAVPFGHDEKGQELRSRMAEQAEQQRFLQAIMTLQQEGSTADKEGEEEEAKKMEAAWADMGVTLASQDRSGEDGQKDAEAAVDKTRAGHDRTRTRTRQQNGPRL